MSKIKKKHPSEEPLSNKGTESKTRIEGSSYWQRLKSKAEQSINDFPTWSAQQTKVQKTGNLQYWLTDTIGANEREAEIIKKVLSDIYKEL